MSDDAAFRRRWQSRIDGCGPYCSCLVLLLIFAFAFFLFLLH
jgi:hypothetical protein